MSYVPSSPTQYEVCIAEIVTRKEACFLDNFVVHGTISWEPN
jgi:hypothetical protein